MYAVARINTFDPEKLATAGEDLDNFNAAHAAQPGYQGSVVVDLQPGRQLVLNLWENEERANTGREALGAQVGRLLTPLLARPSEFLGAGPVRFTDLQPRQPASSAVNQPSDSAAPASFDSEVR
jgi:hypothetical protein